MFVQQRSKLFSDSNVPQRDPLCGETCLLYQLQSSVTLGTCLSGRRQAIPAENSTMAGSISPKTIN